MERAFGVVKISANRKGVLTIAPLDAPYFEPHRIRFRAFDCTGQVHEDLDFKIGAVTVGGSPQLAINNLAPDHECRTGSISPRDLDKVNWSTFSTAGLARELQISVYNPHDIDLLIYACVEGRSIGSLDCYDPPKRQVTAENKLAAGLEVECPLCEAKVGEPCQTRSKTSRKKRTGRRTAMHLLRRDKGAAGQPQETWQDLSKRRREERLEKRRIAEEWWKNPDGSLQHSSSETVEIRPRAHRLLRVRPMVSPYFRPRGARVHASSRDGGPEVPMIVVDMICGRTSMFGGMISMLENLPQPNRQPFEDGPYEALDRLRGYIGLMEIDGIAGITKKRMERIKRTPVLEVVGIPNTLLEDPGLENWHDISDFPAFSTEGLSMSFGVLLYNPWPFVIRVSVTVCGEAMSRLG